MTSRLVLWYVVLSGALATVIFAVLYATLISNLAQRVDEDLEEDVVELMALYRQEGIDAVAAEFKAEVDSDGAENVFFRLRSPYGEVLASTDMSQWHRLRSQREPHPEPGEMSLITLDLPGREDAVRIITHKADDGTTLEVGCTLQDDEELAAQYRTVFAAGLVASLLCSGFAGWLLARRAMSGVRRVTRAAEETRFGTLSHRVPLGREGEEIQNLAVAFNEMLQRIQTLVTNLTQVGDNIAHDVRSPITRVRGIAETALAGEQDLDAYREMAAAVIEESDRMAGLIETILEVARADSGAAVYERNVVDLVGLLGEACELFEPVAEDKGVRIEQRLPSEPVLAIGDVRGLQRVVANLLDNALNHTPAAGTVRLTAAAVNEHAIITVADTGEGIAPDALPHIFDRFYRGDPSRGGRGHGLGLSLVRAIVEANGGQVSVESRPGEGCTFTVRMPRATSAGDTTPPRDPPPT